MNLEHPRIVFGPCVNFLTGDNGSGKSTILIALCIGLGAIPKHLDRDGALHGFIRRGEILCSIKLVICNKGARRYRPELYGDTITVERRITDKSNAFRIKDTDLKKPADGAE
jgi:chromosome segregation ATPase